ncbi:MAG TPA: trypsin-like peptidase domain-containing protein [Vicinamibacterales bacterium]|jgi:S1-C subfamily serine protease|nr:trypsin-like peptidase domain-containing protein [Vicinamibacterales bacterium]
MTNSSLLSLSNDLADLAAAKGTAIVQVLGSRRPASGVIHGIDTVLTTGRAIGREDGVRVRIGDADPIEAEMIGWDPATSVAVLRTSTKLDVAAPAIADNEPRVGQIAVALARSWSNALTASAGIVAVVGGPLRTGRRRQIARVIRVTAPMHDGFAGGGLFDASGQLTGIATAAVIRGFAVAIPASIAWASARQIVTTGGSRGFMGVAVQPVHAPTAFRTDGRERALLIVGVTPGSPAETAGIIVGDVLLEFAGARIESAEDLLDRLTGDRVGQKIQLKTLHGGVPREVDVIVASRPR